MAPKTHIPENFEEVLEQREATIKDQWIGTMEARIVRENLVECWKKEGVNHYESCADLSQKYLELLRNSRMNGYKKLQF